MLKGKALIGRTKDGKDVMLDIDVKHLIPVFGYRCTKDGVEVTLQLQFSDFHIHVEGDN